MLTSIRVFSHLNTFTMIISKSSLLYAMLFLTGGFFLTSFLSEKNQAGLAEIEKDVKAEEFFSHENPIFNTYYEWCEDLPVSISGSVPSGVTFDWIGPAIPGNCPQNVTPNYTSVTGSATVILSGAASPVGSMCKYRYSLTENGDTNYFIVAVRILASPCPIE